VCQPTINEYDDDDDDETKEKENEFGENKLLRPKSSWVHIRQKRSEVEKNTPNRINETPA